MKLLQRYLLSELLRVFCLVLAVLTVMLVFIGLFQEATERGLGPLQVLQILPYVVPSLLPFTIPATLLLAVTVVYGRIAGDLEVTAAKAAGISAMKLLSPAFGLGIVLTIGSFCLTNFTIPWAIGNVERIVSQAMEQIFLDLLGSRHLYSDADRGFSVTVQEVRNGVLVNPTFRRRTSEHQQMTIRAAAARIRFDLEDEVIRLQLKDAQFSRPGADMYGKIDFHELELPLPSEISKTKPRHVTLGGIHQRLQELEATAALSRQQVRQEAAMLLLTGETQGFASDRMVGYAVAEYSAQKQMRRFRTEIHSRFSMAAGCFFFTLIGAPFSVLQARRQFITSFIMCFLPILLVYYPLMFLMVNLSRTGTVNPAWAMWVPNAVLLTAAAFVLRKVIRY